MVNRLLIVLTLLIGAFIHNTHVHAATAVAIDQTALADWIGKNWWHYCASLDLDFLNDRYYINNNTSCDGSTGTQYSGVNNFISGAGATFTRAGTTNVTDTNPPSYIDTTQGQAFVSRASSAYNITTFTAPFYASAGGGQTFVSRADSAAVATYFDSTGTLQTAAKGAARSASYSYNGSTWVNGGLLLEPSTTNSLHNNTMQGAVAGTPGTLPTSWQYTANSDGLTEQIVGTGVESGINYIDIAFSGTAASNAIYFYLDSVTGVTAAFGQIWTTTIYLELAAGNFTNVSMSYNLSQRNSSGTALANIGRAIAVPTSANLSSQRYSNTGTLNASSTAYVTPMLVINTTMGSAINFTLRIGMPQLEQNPSATSVIATSTAAVSRPADVYAQEPASYFDSTGTLQYEAANTPRTNYTYSGGTWTNAGTLIEPAATNSLPNNSMSGAVAADGVERTTSGTFSGCSGSTCTGWTTNVNGGTGTVSYASNTATLTGDGTNAASIYQAIPTVSGYTYTIAVTNGAGNAVTVQAGTAAGGATLLTASSAAASTTTSYQFRATSTSSYIQINDTSMTAANVTAASAQSAGKFPTSWLLYNVYGIAAKVIGAGTESGISYIDINFSGFPQSIGPEQIIWAPTTSISAALGQAWTPSVFQELTSGTIPSHPYFAIDELNSSGTQVAGANYGLATPTNSQLSLQRVSATRLLTNSATAYVYASYYFAFVANSTVNFTLRFGLPQMEQSSYTTSPIPTVSAAVTRNADVYSTPNGGTYFNSAGVLKTAPANTPRLDHSPTIPFGPLGVLIEESRANLVGNSLFSTCSYCSLVTNAAAAPDASSTAGQLVEDTSGNRHFTGKTATIVAGGTYSYSVFLKGGVRTFAYIYGGKSGTPFTRAGIVVSLTDGSFSTFDSGTPAAITNRSVTALANGWYRADVSDEIDTSSTDGYLEVGACTGPTGSSCTYTGDGSSGIFVWGAQIEAGAFPTSYIPTSGATVTRAGEVFTLPTTAGSGSGWYSQAVGTLGGSFVSPYAANNGTSSYIADIDDGTNQNAIQEFITGSGGGLNRFEIFNSGNFAYGLTGSSYLDGTTAKMVMAFQVNNTNAAYNGTTSKASTSASVPSGLTTLRIGKGRGSGGSTDGWITRLWYQPVRDVDQTLSDYSR